MAWHGDSVRDGEPLQAGQIMHSSRSAPGVPSAVQGIAGGVEDGRGEAQGGLHDQRRHAVGQHADEHQP